MPRGTDQTKLDALKRECTPLSVMGWPASGGWVIRGTLNDEKVIEVKAAALGTAIQNFRDAFAKALQAGIIKK